MEKVLYGVKQGNCMCHCFEVWTVGEDWQTHSDFYQGVFENRQDAEDLAEKLNNGQEGIN
jgi:hypothetical protein